MTFQLLQLATVVEACAGDFVNVLLHHQFTVQHLADIVNDVRGLHVHRTGSQQSIA